jgi:hypothetical protein
MAVKNAEIRQKATGNQSRFRAYYGTREAWIGSISSQIGMDSGITPEVGLIGKSHFRDRRKALKQKGKRPASYNWHYVNFS